MTTSHEYRGYVFTIAERSREPGYSVDFPDIPDIITSGESFTAAFAHACEALDLHLETLAKLGDEMPKARHRLVVESAS